MTKEHMAQQIWLDYYNRYLLDQGVITEAMYRKMQSLIRTRKTKLQ